MGYGDERRNEVPWPEPRPIKGIRKCSRGRRPNRRLAHVAEVRFRDDQPPAFEVDFESTFVTLHLATTDRAALVDHLRHERSVVLDTEAGTLKFGK